MENKKLINKFRDISDLDSKELLVTPIPYTPLPTLEDYEKGVILRFFTQKINDPTVIYEVSPQNPSSNLYVIYPLYWKLTGPKHDIRNEHNLIIEFGVLDTNKRIVYEAEKQLPGISKVLTDYSELTVYSPFTPQSIKEKFLGK